MAKPPHVTFVLGVFIRASYIVDRSVRGGGGWREHELRGPTEEHDSNHEREESHELVLET